MTECSGEREHTNLAFVMARKRDDMPRDLPQTIGSLTPAQMVLRSYIPNGKQLMAGELWKNSGACFYPKL